MRQLVTIRRVAAAAATAAILVSAIGIAPAVARSGGHVSQSVGQRHGAAINRGHLNLAAAAAAAKGVTRPVSRLPDLPVPGGRTTDAGQTPPTLSNGREAVKIPFSAPSSIISWQGINVVNDGIALDPPDPWVAVNSTYVVQSVNSLVRIYDRNFNEQLTVPTWAMFALTPEEQDADPRIVWDSAHGRWIGVLLSYVQPGATVDAGYLNVAISDGADPRGSWQVFSYSYGDGTHATLPDYPGISSSSDTVAISANEFDYTMMSYLGASLLTFRWSDLLAGNTGAPAQWTNADPTVYTIRPAIAQGTMTGAHLVAQDADTGDILYARLTSAATAPNWYDVTTGRVVPGITSSPPGAPRQPGPDTISRAVDARITDAVWRGNRLAFVSTYAMFGDDYMRVTVLDTTTASPTVTRDSLDGSGGGTDAYMGGLGFTANGNLIAVWTESSTSLNPRTMAARLDPDSTTSSIYQDINGSYTPYSDERWGDYLGVAIDPAGSDTVWVGDETVAYDGSWTTTIQRLSVDVTQPLITNPVQSLVAGTTLGALVVPVKVSWTATDTGSGVSESDLAVNQFGNGFYPAGNLPTTSVTRLHYWKAAANPSDFSYQYAVAAWDRSSNATGQLAGPPVTATLYQQTSATYSGSWVSKTGGAFAGNSVKYSKTVGASASFKTSGRSFAFVTTKGSGYGKAKVYVDGKLKATVTLGGATKYRNLAYVINFASAGTHTIKVVVASGRVDVDAFLVLK